MLGKNVRIPVRLQQGSGCLEITSDSEMGRGVGSTYAECLIFVEQTEDGRKEIVARMKVPDSIAFLDEEALVQKFINGLGLHRKIG